MTFAEIVNLGHVKKRLICQAKEHGLFYIGEKGGEGNAGGRFQRKE